MESSTLPGDRRCKCGVSQFIYPGGAAIHCDHCNALLYAPDSIPDVPATSMKKLGEWNILSTVIAGTDIPIRYPKDNAIGAELLRKSIWAPELCAWLKSFVSRHPSKHVIVIGAHVGQGSLMCARYTTSGTVYSFEPHPELYKLLVENTKSFPNIKTFNCGIGPNPGIYNLRCNKRNSGDNIVESIFEEYSAVTNLPPAYSDIECELRKLNVFNIDFDNVGAVKIDAQGMDRDIFESIYKLLPLDALVVMEKTGLTVKYMAEKGIKHTILSGDYLFSMKDVPNND